MKQGDIVYGRKRGSRWHVYVLTSFITVCALLSAFWIWDIVSGGNWLWNNVISPIKGLVSPGSVEDFNVIIGGLDDVGDTRRTDSIIVAHVSVSDKKMSAVFIPRDSRVEIPGRRGLDKINAAFSYGSADLMKNTIDKFLGIQTQYYVVLYVKGFVKLIDSMGGVDVCVDKRMKYTDDSQDLRIDLQPGCQHLDGYNTMCYARFRHDAEGDFGRIKRQQQIMKILSEKALSADMITHLPGVLSVLFKEKLADTNIPMDKMLALMHMYNRDMQRNLNAHMVLGTPQTIGGISYVIPDYDDLPYLTGSVFKDGYDPANKKIKIEVLNGNRYHQMAEIYARRLGYYGFDIIGTGNAKSFDNERTQVVVHRDTPFAQKIADLLGAEVVSQPDDKAISDLQVVIGRDKNR